MTDKGQKVISTAISFILMVLLFTVLVSSIVQGVEVIILAILICLNIVSFAIFKITLENLKRK